MHIYKNGILYENGIVLLERSEEEFNREIPTETISMEEADII